MNLNDLRAKAYGAGNNPEKSNANLLYKKPINNNNSFRNINKNNSMYVKQIVPYESKKNSMFNKLTFVPL